MSKLTKKEIKYIKEYEQSQNYNLLDLYDKPSIEKVKAVFRIIEQMRKKNGYGLKFLSGNTCTFTCGYRYVKDNKIMLRIETYKNSYDIDVT